MPEEFAVCQALAHLLPPLVQYSYNRDACPKSTVPSLPTLPTLEKIKATRTGKCSDKTLDTSTLKIHMGAPEQNTNVP